MASSTELIVIASWPVAEVYCTVYSSIGLNEVKQLEELRGQSVAVYTMQIRLLQSTPINGHYCFI